MRLLIIFLASLGLLIGTSTAQTQYAINGYKYDGCVQIDPSHFEVTHSHPADGRTPEDCEELCKDYAYVGVFEDACRCGNNIDEVNRQADLVCNNPCKGDPTLGWCGSGSHACTHYANLYCLIHTQPYSNFNLYPNPNPGSLNSPHSYPSKSIQWSPITSFWPPLPSETNGSGGGYAGSYTYPNGPDSNDPYTSAECPGQFPWSPGGGSGPGNDSYGNGNSGLSTFTYISNDQTFTTTYTPTSWTWSTLTTTLGTYTFSAHTSSSTTTLTTTLSGADEAYTTIMYTSVSLTVIPGEYTSTVKTTVVTPTVVSEAARMAAGIIDGKFGRVVLALAVSLGWVVV